MCGRVAPTHINSVELSIVVALVLAGSINPVFFGDDFPKLGADLVTALSAYDLVLALLQPYSKVY